MPWRIACEKGYAAEFPWCFYFPDIDGIRAILAIHIPTRLKSNLFLSSFHGDRCVRGMRECKRRRLRLVASFLRVPILRCVRG